MTVSKLNNETEGYPPPQQQQPNVVYQQQEQDKRGSPATDCAQACCCCVAGYCLAEALCNMLCCLCEIFGAD